jgi:hypothetical protein
MTVSTRRRNRQSRYDSWEQVIAFSLSVIIGIVIVALGGSDKWLTASFATLVPFIAIISSFRDRWGLVRFWLTLGILFMIHMMLIWLIFGVLLRQRTDVGLLICVPAMLAESSILYYLVKALEARLAE